VNGPLADLLTGGSGAERVLHELEDDGAPVASLDAQRSWFRYCPLFADLLQLELRRTAPDEIDELHLAATTWYAGHGYPVEAIRHAQAAGDWSLACRLLADNWVSLQLGGRQATAHALLAAFPARVTATDAEAAAMAAGDQLLEGSLEDCARHLEVAARRSASLPEDRRARLQAWLALLRLSIASRGGDLPAALGDAERLLATADGMDAAELGPCEYRALALVALGEAELATFRLDEAESHLEEALALARTVGLAFLEITVLAALAHLGAVRPSSFAAGVQRSTEAIRLAQLHGWSEEPIAGVAYAALGGATLMQGRLDEAESLLARAERTLGVEDRPTAGAHLHLSRGLLELARGREENALAAFRACERLVDRVFAPATLARRARALRLHTLVRMGDVGQVEQILAAIKDEDRESAEMRVALAALRLAKDDPEAATVALAPVVDSADVGKPDLCALMALLLEAMARDALGDTRAAAHAVERALDLAEPNGALLPFMLQPVPELLECHRRSHTSHAWLVGEILSVLAADRSASRPGDREPLREPLSECETRVLRYLPTNLSAPEIAVELYVALTTVKTHIHQIYVKLGVHRRAEAVERARALGLLAPSGLKAR
jgi:LuxR family transcriptional regulator, maltose regulon positive regulatory protein